MTTRAAAVSGGFASGFETVAGDAVAGIADEAGALDGPGSATPATDSVFGATGAAIVSAVIVDPTTDLARAVGVLKSAAVDAIGVDPTVTTFAALGAGAPASAFGAAGLNESRIFCAAVRSCPRMCGICS